MALTHSSGVMPPVFAMPFWPLHHVLFFSATFITMDRALRFFAPQSAPARLASEVRAQARLLTPGDLPALLELEHEKWNAGQAASRAQLLARIEAHPELAMGAFCVRTGKLLASLFLKPVPDDFERDADTWQACVAAVPPRNTRSLFGISLSSRDTAGVEALFAFFWPRALTRGWRYVYLGSPVPGLRAWRQRHPHASVDDYVYRRHGGRPFDPQLRYYHRRGFTKIVGVKRDYFPHERSLDYGVLLRRTVPLSLLAPVWQRLPAAWITRLTRTFASLL